MIGAAFKVMFLSLIRDRGALVLAFILPPIVYLLFAAIFSGTTSDDLRLRLAIYDEARTETTSRLIDEIESDAAFRKTQRQPVSAQDLSDMVRLDEADVGLLLRADPGVIDRAAASAPLVIIGDAAKAVAAPTAMGQIQRIIAERLPDVAYRRIFSEVEQRFVQLEPAQKQKVSAILERLQADAQGRAPGAAVPDEASPVIERRNLAARAIEDPSVVYYAGAVAMMFLLFASLQGAMQIIDERQSGVLDRVLFGAGSGIALITGKFAFLVLQGVVQVGLIFAAASWAYGVAITGNIPAWLMITTAAAALAAGAGLLLSAAARSRQQAQTLSTFIILILSAIGGSMVPRFLMPAWLQDVSWAVPNAWIVEAYHGLLWRSAPLAETLWLIVPATGVALVCLVSAMALLHTQARH